jgi:tetratricopeptide (TPR) repeat protein
MRTNGRFRLSNYPLTSNNMNKSTSKRLEKKKKRYEFFEQPRPVMDDWYELLEGDHSTDDYLNLIKKDPDFYDSYLSAADDIRDSGNEKAARKLEDEAFSRARVRVEDAEGNWPDEMPWGWLENRHVVRALGVGADNLWKDGNTDEALAVYRKLFRSNFRDNIGARYAIIALRLGYSYSEYQDNVWPEDLVPASHIMEWFNKHASKFPEELAEWKAYAKRELGLEEADLG